MTAGVDACAVFSPAGAIWACAAAAGSKKPARAADSATFPIRFMTPTINPLSGRNVSDCSAKVNCVRESLSNSG